MQKVVINLPDRIGVVFKLKDGIVVCNAPDLEARFNATGVIGLDGCKYYPHNGKIFLEAVYDHYFLKGAYIGSMDKTIKGQAKT
ncbi:MAG: hypothetical protein HY203_00300 [Nitrospirae bacterium]|nr:hypothetical protein [Nitrospirota bacterium]